MAQSPATMVDRQQAVGAAPKPASPARGRRRHRLWNLAFREASTLAYADAFRAAMFAFIVATLLVPPMRKVGTPKAPAR